MGRGSEEARLASLASYAILDTAPELAFDRLTGLAAELFDCPIALVSLIDADRQWFKSKVGLDAEQTPRCWAFCAHAIQQDAESTLVVEDATQDPRFRANPLVVGNPKIRFYAGAVLTNADGHNLGTLCVIDTAARAAPTDKDIRRLQALAGIVVDEMELRRAERSANNGRRLLELAEHMSGVGHWRFDIADRRVTWSDEIYSIHGVVRGDFEPNLDQALNAYCEEDRGLLLSLIERALATGQGYEQNMRIRRPDGEIRHVVTKADCLLGPRRDVVALFGVLQDVTDQRTALLTIQREQAATAAALAAMEEQVRRTVLAETIAGLGSWRLDMRTGQLTWTDPTFDIYGLDRGEAPSIEQVKAMIHPDDREASQARIKTVLETGYYESRSAFRIIRGDGEVRHLAADITVERGPDDAIIAVIGTVMDVTDEKAAKQALTESEARYRLLAETGTDMIVRVDRDATVLYVSPACRQFGYEPDDLIGRRYFDLLHPEDAAVSARLMPGFLDGSQPSTAARQYRLAAADGSWVWVEGSPSVARDDQGRVLGVVTAVRNISQRKALEDSLAAAKDAAEAGARAKADFLANMSHEIRTPLTSIVGFSALLDEQPELGPNSRKYVSRVLNGAKALLSVVNDVLDFSKLEAGEIQLRREVLSPVELAENVLQLFESQAAAKTIALKLARDHGTPNAVLGDPDRLRQILLNLTGNAVKFTEAGAVVVAICRPRPDWIRFEIKDSGPGISAEGQSRLFERFSQVDQAQYRTAGGTGLGLAICKGLVAQMGGRVGVRSALGQGSSFWFEIPAPEAALDTAGPDAGPPAAPRSGARILVVDDNAANRELASRILETLDLEISTADGGAACLELAARMPFDLILMDIRMPEIDGPAALARIRSTGGPNADVPIVAFTAEADPQSIATLMRDGFDGHIAKPIKPSDLIKAVVHWTAHRETVQATALVG